MSARSFLGSGDLYIAPIINGVLGDYEGPFECDKFEIKPSVEQKKAISKGRNRYGQVIEAVNIPKEATLTVDLTEVNSSALLYALMGTTSSYTQASGTVTDQAVTLVKGKWKSVGKIKIGTVVVTTTGGSPVTLVEGDDYIVNYNLGWVKSLKDSVTSVLIDYTHAAVTGTTIKGQTNTNVRARFKLDGENYVDNSDCEVTVYEAVLAAESAFDFLANDFGKVSLPGTMKTPAGFIEPFIVRVPPMSV